MGVFSDKHAIESGLKTGTAGQINSNNNGPQLQSLGSLQVFSQDKFCSSRTSLDILSKVSVFSSVGDTLQNSGQESKGTCPRPHSVPGVKGRAVLDLSGFNLHVLRRKARSLGPATPHSACSLQDI